MTGNDRSCAVSGSATNAQVGDVALLEHFEAHHPLSLPPGRAERFRMWATHHPAELMTMHAREHRSLTWDHSHE